MFNEMNGESLDLTAQNITRLKELFPEILTDGDKIDFEMLKTILGEVVETEQERYQFTWHGKKKMIAGTQKPSKGTLRPDREKSKDFDTTENLYIEGDNLEVLKLLQKSYNGKIKMIYIDPPYNTGKDFVYKDNFKDGVQNYLEQTGQVDADGNILSTNSESNGRFHTDWLNMIYPRLKLARNLLTEDGVIFISIDDNELANLKKITDEVFGDNNFINQFSIVSNSSKNNSKYVSTIHEYLLCYSRNKQNLGDVWKIKKNNIDDFKKRAELLFNKGLNNDEIKEQLRELVKYPKFYDFDHYVNVDERGPFRASDLTAPGSQTFYDIIHPVTGEKCKSGTRGWAYSEVNFLKLVNEGRIYFGSDESVMPQLKNYLFENEYSTPKSALFFDSQSSTKWMKSNGFNFSFPKAIDFIKYVISILPSKNFITLDFFSGSATTAHATMQLNAEDGGNRKFIMVQLPEVIDEKSEAYKDGYRTICDIGEERIRRAGEKVKEELKEKQQKVGMLEEDVMAPESLDIGFKVLKLDTSNIREWNVDFANLEESLDLYETPFVEGRSELDIVYEIMLKQGLELSHSIETFVVNGKIIYEIAFGHLFICLANGITTDIARAIVAGRDEFETKTSSVIFSDTGFSNDSDKLNCIEILKDAGYPEDNLLTI